MIKPNAYGLVKIKIPGLNGLRPVSGRIIRTLPDGRIEIKTQNDGYWTVKKSEVID